MSEVTITLKEGGSVYSYLIRYIIRIKCKLQVIASNFIVKPEIRLHFEVRIDGIFYAYKDPAGCSHLKFFKKRGFIAITIAITDKETALPTDELLDFFKESLYIGLSQMFDRLLKNKYTLENESLFNLMKENIESFQKPTEDN